MKNAVDIADGMQAFFDTFCMAFAEFDGALIAQRYAAPYVSLNTDGVTKVFNTREEIGQYFQGVLDKYREQGCRLCRFKDLHLVPLGQMSALASVTWELLRGDGSIANTWRESYNLTGSSGKLLIYASTDHVELEPFPQ